MLKNGWWAGFRALGRHTLSTPVCQWHTLWDAETWAHREGGHVLCDAVKITPSAFNLSNASNLQHASSSHNFLHS